MSAANAMKKAWQKITDDAVKGSNKTKSAVDGMKSAFSSLGKKTSQLGSLLANVLGPIALIGLAKQCIDLGSSVSEVQNVVDTAFGSMSHKMEAFADTAITSFGMSELAAKKTGSTYMAMAKGIGIADGAASDMAITLTGLSGDVASFYNISQDLASTKLKSVFTGETETLKDLGVVMTQTNLEQYALSRGISKSISAMTQAELATLRYNFVLDSLNLASGDFVKTQDSWANQTRILSMQMQALGANVGQILTTVLLPAVKTLNEIVANLVSATSIISAAISSIFGVQISQNSQIASTAAEAAEAENNLAAGISNAAKAAKKSLAGFDDLNIIQNNASGDSGSSVSLGGIGTVQSNNTVAAPNSDYDTAEVERVAEIIKEIAGYVPVIAAGLAGLKLGKFIADLSTAKIEVKTLKEGIALIGKKAGLIAGVTLSVTGIALEAKGISEAIKKGLNKVNFSKILGGGGAIAAGGALIGKMLGSALLGGAIGGIVAGIPAFITGVYDAIVGGIDWLNATLVSIGAAAAGAGIGFIFGGPVGAAIGAGIGLVVGLVTDGIIYLVQVIIDNWESICAFFAQAAEWFNTNVIQPIASFFSGLWEGISAAASTCWNAIVEFFTPAVQWFSQLFGSILQTITDIFYNIGVIAGGCWQIISAVWGVVAGWFDINIIQPISGFFTGLWEGLKEGASEAWEGIKSVFRAVGKFFGDTFSAAWQGIVDVFSVAGDIFVDIKEGVVTAFTTIVNALITGINKVVSVPFDGINWALKSIRNVEVVGVKPFSWIKTISVPQIPYLAQGAVIPPNREFLAVLGDQKHGTNIEAPLSTIQEAVALELNNQLQGMMAGFNAVTDRQERILQAILGLDVSDASIAGAVDRYHRKMAMAAGGL